MQAVILSGGLGTRLRPLTYTIPKPLLPLSNVPMMEYVMSVLPRDVDRVVLASNYMVGTLKSYFASSEHPFEVIINTEPEPLGTGGAVKFAQRYIDDTFFVLNGDLISSLDTTKMLEHHRKHRGLGTLALFEVEDPTPFGMVTLQGDDRIGAFREKPRPSEVTSHTINAGTYLLEPEVLDHIPAGRTVSIERETFPSVIDRGLYGEPFSGFWCDAGTLPKFLEANRIVLEHARQLAPPLLGETGPGVELSGGVCTGRGSMIGSGSQLENTVLLDNVNVGGNCRIVNSIVGADTVVGDGCVISDTIVGFGQDIADGSVLKGHDTTTTE